MHDGPQVGVLSADRVYIGTDSAYITIIYYSF